MRLVTAEYIGRGHPDKLADQISDAVVQWHTERDKNAHCAVETMVKDDTVILAGEIKSTAYLDHEEAKAIVKAVLKDVGYEKEYNGIDKNYFNLIFLLNDQSSDIEEAVKDGDKDQGAGDQGIVIGAATNETPENMPLAYMIAYNLIKRYESLLPHLTHARPYEYLQWAKADCKSQVTLKYDEYGELEGIDTIVMSVQHDERVNLERMRQDIMQSTIIPVLSEHRLAATHFVKDTKFLINPSGRFVIGGPKGDCGLTGRKIIADTYGSIYRHGGGAFSGKDLSKTDRSGAYYARMIANSIVSKGITKDAEVEIAFAIGYNRPVAVRINSKCVLIQYDKAEKELETIKQAILDTSINDMINRVKENLETKGLDYKTLSTTGVVRL